MFLLWLSLCEVFIIIQCYLSYKNTVINPLRAVVAFRKCLSQCGDIFAVLGEYFQIAPELELLKLPKNNLLESCSVLNVVSDE